MSFLSGLTRDELQRLRQVIRKVHQQQGLPIDWLTDRECDKLIEVHGAEVMERQVEAMYEYMDKKVLVGVDGSALTSTCNSE